MTRHRRHDNRAEVIDGEWRPIVSAPHTPAPKVDPGGRWTRETPVREPTIEADWGVPFATSLTIAAGIALGCVVIPMIWLEHTFWQSWRYGATAFVIVQVFSFLAARDIVDKTIWQLEEMTGADLSGDGHIGRPTTTIEVYNDNRNQQTQQQRRDRGDTWQEMHRLRIDVEPEKFKQFAEAINAGASLSVSRWTNGKNGIFTRGEFDSMIDELTQRGLIEYKDPNTPQLGRHITERGKHVFSQIAQKQLPKPHTRKA